MGGDLTIYAAILLMALVVYATRVAGAEVMTLFRLSPRMEGFLKSMAGSVLVAIVASEMARGGLRENTAIIAAGLVMALTRSSTAAISVGVVVAMVYSRMLS